MAELVIQYFGPIRHCKIEEKRFMILTGAQASGKSTIAKVIFFFRTVAEDVIQQIRTKKTSKQVFEDVRLVVADAPRHETSL